MGDGGGFLIRSFTNPSCRLAACTLRYEKVFLRTVFVTRISFCHPRSLIRFSIKNVEDRRQGQAIFNQGSRVFAFFFVREENDAGFPITNVGND